MIEETNKQKQTSSNPFGMKFSYNFLFNSDSGTHSGTEITSGVLKPTGTTGTWTSPAKEHSYNITTAYLKMIGEKIENVSISVSANNGDNYQSISNNNKIDFTATGQQLRIKAEITDSTSRIDSLSILYSDRAIIEEIASGASSGGQGESQVSGFSILDV